MNDTFITYTEDILGSKAAARLLDAIENSPSPVSVRFNPFKIQQPPSGVQVPWNRYGRYLPERPSFTLDPLHHAGQYYVQEASSMFVEHIFREAKVPESPRVLDLCAAPGGKATLYSTLAGLEGMVVANETVRSRASVLADNVTKWGLGNVIVTNNEASHFKGFNEWFDIVAVDAPCSGEGMFRKSGQALEQWSPENVKMCAARQRKILSEIWDALKPGGVLIYSTCTYNRYENEENVEWLVENFDCEDAGITVTDDWNIHTVETAGIRCFRFFPHLVAGEGFFAAAIRKGGQKGRPSYPKPRRTLFAQPSRQAQTELSRWVSQPDFMQFAQIGDNIYGYYEPTFRDMKAAAENLTAIHSGIFMGQLFGGKLKPEHSLALFHDINREAVKTAELGIDDALAYLRKDNLPDIGLLAEGLNLVSFEGNPIGWIKRIGNRANNMYPKPLMIFSK